VYGGGSAFEKKFEAEDKAESKPSFEPSAVIPRNMYEAADLAELDVSSEVRHFASFRKII